MGGIRNHASFWREEAHKSDALHSSHITIDTDNNLKSENGVLPSLFQFLEQPTVCDYTSHKSFYFSTQPISTQVSDDFIVLYLFKQDQRGTEKQNKTAPTSNRTYI